MVGKLAQTVFPDGVPPLPLKRSKVVSMSIVSGNNYLQTHRIDLSPLSCQRQRLFR
jgi:hypothetical protein